MLLTAACSSALLLGAGSSSAATTPQSFYGVDLAVPPSQHDWDLMESSGVGSVRIAVFWDEMQPGGDGPIDFGPLDELVGRAADHGIEVLPFVTGTPKPLARNAITMPIQTSRQRQAWTAFLAALAARYGPGGEFWQGNPYSPYLPIRSWEIWNEQNTPFFAKPVSAAAYDRLLIISAQALRNIDPNAEVLVGAMLGRPAAKPPEAYPADLFLDKMYRAAPVRGSFDGMGLNPYSEHVSQIGVQTRKVRQVYARHHDSGKSVAITEVAWGSGRPGSRWLAEGPQGQAHKLTQAYKLFRAHRLGWNISSVYWFSWHSHVSVPQCVFCRTSGLLDLQGNPTPALHAYQRLAG